jgi:hypothetical protein
LKTGETARKEKDTLQDTELIRELRATAQRYIQAANTLSAGLSKTGIKTATSATRQLSAATRRKMALSQKKRWGVVTGGAITGGVTKAHVGVKKQA